MTTVGAPREVGRVRRFWKALTTKPGPDGWDDVPDDRPPWTATIEARWMSPPADWSLITASLFIVGIGLVAAASLWATGRGLWVLVPIGGAVWFGRDLLRHVRAVRQAGELTLVLGPDRLTLTSVSPSVPAASLQRDDAGWLVGVETGPDWHQRFISLGEGSRRPVAEFLGGLAQVRLLSPGEPRDPLPRHLPVSVLLGCWWPHPARRMTRTGSRGIQRHWLEPDIAGFPRHERRQRLQWTLLYGVFALFCVWAAVFSSAPATQRVVLGLIGVMLLAWRLRVHQWKPEFR